MKHPLESHNIIITARLTDPSLVALFETFRARYEPRQIDSNTYLMGSRDKTTVEVIEELQTLFKSSATGGDELYISGMPAGIVRIVPKIS